MTVEYAGRKPNGIHRVRIDNAERVITIVASEGWRIEIIPAVAPGPTIQEVDGPVRMPGLVERGVLAEVPGVRSFVCVETREVSKDPA